MSVSPVSETRQHTSRPAVGHVPGARPAATPTAEQLAQFRSGFRRTAGSVSVITTAGVRPAGFTATSLTSVSVDPLLVSFNVSRTASSWPSVQRSHHFAAHVLRADQYPLAAIFATSGIDRFAAAEGQWEIGAHGLPVLRDYLVRFVLAVHDRIEAGDSTLVLAEVVNTDHHDGAPLVYHDGTYR